MARWWVILMRPATDTGRHEALDDAARRARELRDIDEALEWATKHGNRHWPWIDRLLERRAELTK